MDLDQSVTVTVRSGAHEGRVLVAEVRGVLDRRAEVDQVHRVRLAFSSMHLGHCTKTTTRTAIITTRSGHIIVIVERLCGNFLWPEANILSRRAQAFFLIEEDRRVLNRRAEVDQVQRVAWFGREQHHSNTTRMCLHMQRQLLHN